MHGTLGVMTEQKNKVIKPLMNDGTIKLYCGMLMIH